MSNVPGELVRVQDAFAQPTLTLLQQRTAPVIIAIFRSAFGRDTRTVGAAHLHEQVDTYLDELRQVGATDLPSGTGRELCLRWMRGQWLMRATEADGSDVYSLTSYAQDALNLVRSLTRDRASLSEHRIATILAAVRRFNTEVNPDRAARVSILDSEIARLTAERDRLLTGGDLPEISEDYLLEGYTELLDLVTGLPSDFARVEEAFTRFRKDILASFRAESRTAGEVVGDYLQRASDMMTATAEGRAFEGAFALLRDDALLLQLQEDLAGLLSHPLTGDILREADKRDLRGTVQIIRNGIEDVLAQRKRVTATLRDYIVTHDVTRDRELDSVLRQLDTEVGTWMQTARARAQVDLPLLPLKQRVEHLKEKFHDIGADDTPPPLRDPSVDVPDGMTLRDLLLQGGPSLEALRRALQQSLDGADHATLGALFDGLDPSLRRPVEIFGLLHLATNLPTLVRRDAVELYDTVRIDGTVRPFHVPVLLPAGSPATTDAATNRAATDTGAGPAAASGSPDTAPPAPHTPDHPKES